MCRSYCVILFNKKVKKKTENSLFLDQDQGLVSVPVLETVKEAVQETERGEAAQGAVNGIFSNFFICIFNLALVLVIEDDHAAVIVVAVVIRRIPSVGALWRWFFVAASRGGGRGRSARRHHARRRV